MSADIIQFPGNTCLDIDPQAVLVEATKAGLESVVVLGVCDDGTPYMAASTSDAVLILRLMRKLDRYLLEGE